MSQCQSCKFWERDDNTYGLGLCRRFPPAAERGSATGRLPTQFPVTLEVDWCGEWAERKRPIAPPRGEDADPLEDIPAGD